MPNSVAHVSGRTLLFVHYNPESTGSFVDFALRLTQHVARNNQVIVAIAGTGTFTDKVRALGVEVLICPFHENDGSLRYLWRTVRFLWLLKRRHIDLMFVLDYVYWKPAEILAALLLKIPIVAEIHFYKHADDLKGFLSRVSRIVPNSARTAETFVAGGLAQRTEVLRNCLDLTAYADSVPSARDELARADDLLVGFVGVLHPIKGIEYFIEAAIAVSAVVPQARFVVVGAEKYSNWRAQLEELARPLTAGNRLAFLGHRDDIPRVMRALDVLVVPSLEEPFGYVNIEAGAASVPVVASNVGGIPEIVVDGRTGRLVPPGDSAAIRDALVELLQNEPLRRRLGAAARRHIEEHFSLESRLPEWDQLFASVLTAAQ